MSASDRRFACLNDKNLGILAKARKRLLAVLNNFSICVVKNSLSSIVIPSILTSLHFTVLSSIVNIIFLWSISDPRNIIWNLPGFATILLVLKQLKIKCMSLGNFRVASSKFGEHEYLVVSSAKLQTAVSWIKNIKPFIKRLNNIKPRVELCRAPLNITK